MTKKDKIRCGLLNGIYKLLYDVDIYSFKDEYILEYESFDYFSKNMERHYCDYNLPVVLHSLNNKYKVICVLKRMNLKNQYCDDRLYIDDGVFKIKYDLSELDNKLLRIILKRMLNQNKQL